MCTGYLSYIQYTNERSVFTIIFTVELASGAAYPNILTSYLVIQLILVQRVKKRRKKKNTFFDSTLRHLRI